MTFDIPIAWSANRHDGCLRQSEFGPFDSYRSYSSYRSYQSISLRAHPGLSQKTVQIRREHFGASVCPPSGEPFRINHSGLNLRSELRFEKVQDRDLRSFVSDRFAPDHDEYLEFIRQCRELGWSRPMNDWILVGGEPPVDECLTAPDAVYLYPSLACNLRTQCSKCYNPVKTADYQHGHMSLGNVTRLISRLSEMGVFSIVFLGGEPLLYPGLFKALEAASASQMIATLSTNGVLVTEETAEKLAGYVDRVQVSLAGC